MAPVHGPGSDWESPLLLIVIKAMFNLTVKYKKRGPLTQAFWDQCAAKVQQTLLKLFWHFFKIPIPRYLAIPIPNTVPTSKNTKKILNTDID